MMILIWLTLDTVNAALPAAVLDARAEVYADARACPGEGSAARQMARDARRFFRAFKKLPSRQALQDINGGDPWPGVGCVPGDVASVVAGETFMHDVARVVVDAVSSGGIGCGDLGPAKRHLAVMYQIVDRHERKRPPTDVSVVPSDYFYRSMEARMDDCRSGGQPAMPAG